MTATRSGSRYFNSRPSARGDYIGLNDKDEKRQFQFTPLREGRHACDPCYITITRFQFTPLREGRRHRAANAPDTLVFQFTPLREGRLPFRVLFPCLLYFNSRPSARGDVRRRHARAQVLSISIHAPPRGATAKDMQFLQIFCSTLTNQHGLTTVPRNLSRLF